MKKIKLNVGGMHCHSCEMLIGDALQENEGISNAKVDHKKGTVDVEFDDSKINEDKIKSIINKEGYNVK